MERLVLNKPWTGFIQPPLWGDQQHNHNINKVVKTEPVKTRRVLAEIVIVKASHYYTASYDKPRPPTSSLLNESLVWNILRLFQHPLVMTTPDQLTLQTQDPSQASFLVSLAFLYESLESYIALNPSLRLFLMSIQILLASGKTPFSGGKKFRESLP